jgi:hypothetical protein
MISALVQLLALAWFIIGLNFRVDDTQRDINSLQAWQGSAVTNLSAMQTTLTTVQDKQQAAADRGAQTQSELVDIQKTLTLLLQQTAAIDARLDGGTDKIN